MEGTGGKRVFIGRKNKVILLLLLLAFIFGITACESRNEWITSAINKKSSSLLHKENITKFPEGPITIVVPFSPGGGTDNIARALADAAEKHFGQQISVVNKVGKSGSIGLTEGVRAKPDGYTVTLTPVELTTLPYQGMTNLNYKDFKPVLQLNADPAAITVRADAPWNTLKEFLDYAKQNPGKIKVGNSGEGAIWHLAAKTIEKETGVKFSHVFFDGAAPAGVALLGGEIDAVSVSPAEVMTHVKSGQLKILGVMSDARIEEFPELPTFKELGINISIGTWRGLSVPKDTPDEIVSVLAEDFSKAAQEEQFRDIIKKLGMGYKIGQPKEFGEVMKQSDEFFKNMIPQLK